MSLGSVLPSQRAWVTLDLERRELRLEGRRTEWVGPDPWARGETTDRPREHLHPWISDRRLQLASPAARPPEP